MRFARLLACGFGVGFTPKVPGTAGSLVALVAGSVMLRSSPYTLAVAIVLASGAGLWAIAACRADDDPGWVVIDEFVGQWITMLPLTLPTPRGLLAAFVLFRLFDIVKPGPVAWAERLRGSPGVMVDDMVAGLFAGSFMWTLIRLVPGSLD
jgi:phosphatidylglycerophosphatase A